MPVTESHIMPVVFGFHQQTQLFQLRQHGFPAFHGIHTVKSSGVFIHGAVVIRYRDDFQLMPLSDLKVVGIVSRSHLDRAGSEIHLHIVIRHHRNLPVHDRQDHFFPYQVGIPFVGGIDSHAGIAQHGLGTRGRHDHALAAVRAGIPDVPQMAVLLLVFHFRVAQRAAAGGAPVNHPLSAVNQAFFKQAHENLAYSLAAAFVHGKALPAPVTADAHLALLMHDASAEFFFPVPGSFQECFPSDTLLGQSFLPHRLDNLHLGGDRRVIRSRKPKGRIPLHAVIADRCILKDTVHGVPHMQLAGNVGRRHNDGERLFPFDSVRRKSSGFFPVLINLSFDRLRIETGFHIGAGHFCLHGSTSDHISFTFVLYKKDSVLMGGAAGMKSTSNSSRQSGVLLLFLIDDLDAVIITAIFAHAMGQFHLMALRALNDRRHLQLPVGAAAVFASLRNFPLRNCHNSHLLIIIKQLSQPGERILDPRLPGSGISVMIWKPRTILSAKEPDRQGHHGV